MSNHGFTVTHREGAARRGVLRTAHGLVETPAFMPVGTRGTVRGVTHRDLIDAGARILLANTYHLYLRPGDELIAERGGLHRFIGWSGPILTDSGGYQIFSLGPLVAIDEHGARFRSHVDGRLHHLTPALVVDIQARLGSDIAMVLDECLTYPASEEAARVSLERTLRWARQARDRFEQVRAGCGGVTVTNRWQMQFGIAQGGVYPHLRERSARETVAMGFDAYAIGGLSVGEPIDVMYDVTAHTARFLPEDRPRYLMGAGMPDDIVESVARGIDLFDCVIPTRHARNAQLLTSEGRLNIRNARYARDDRPPDPACGCYTCGSFSRAYLRHLFLAQEMTGPTLATLHNLRFYLDTLGRIREAIVFGSFGRFRQEFHRRLSRRPVSS
ncbi:MAG: tRNA guanosine(34) transglycosylase Tgt [Luteitalea sp.]|nr:tRNA guanosine(34) transglycosylase Tgt [Luteitalea sp.]